MAHGGKVHRIRPNLPIGTKVRLKSGGPVMLVVDYDERPGWVWCAWPEGEARLRVLALLLVTE